MWACDKSHVTYVCSWDRSNIRVHTGHIWGHCSWVCSYTDPTRYSWSPKMCEGHKCTLGNWIQIVIIEIIQTVNLQTSDWCIKSLCVSYPGSLDMSGTLSDTDHSEDQWTPACTNTDRPHCISQAQSPQHCNRNLQTKREIKLNQMLMVLKSTRNYFIIHYTSVMWHISK